MISLLMIISLRGDFLLLSGPVRLPEPYFFFQELHFYAVTNLQFVAIRQPFPFEDHCWSSISAIGDRARRFELSHVKSLNTSSACARQNGFQYPVWPSAAIWVSDAKRISKSRVTSKAMASVAMAKDCFARSIVIALIRLVARRGRCSSTVHRRIPNPFDRCILVADTSLQIFCLRCIAQ